MYQIFASGGIDGTGVGITFPNPRTDERLKSKG